ncbi:MAG: hypothetical protein AAGC55_03025, partial [Myxococcota bacterium]
LVNQPSGNASCSNNFLIDGENPEASLLLHTIDPERFPGHADSACSVPRMPLASTAQVPAADVACIEEWVHSVADGGIERQPAPFDPAPVESVANKIKYLLHGGALTEAELALVRDPEFGTLDMAGLRPLIDSWMWDGAGALTPEFDRKLRMFLALALQQKSTGLAARLQYRQQLELRIVDNDGDDVDLTRFTDSVPPMFVDTARDIVTELGDFRRVVTTRRVRVTTAILAALVHADTALTDARGRIPGPDRFGSFDHLRDSDYNDWRYVNLVQATASEPADFQYENRAALSASLRQIGEDGAIRLWAPRVGFFNTLSFFDQWQTNEDNQFRVTTSQALITALDLIFDTSDTTTPASLYGLDDGHAKPGTACRTCHQLLDTARPAFSGYYSYRNRASGPRQGEPSTFAFAGHVVPSIADMNAFAEAVVSHPRFAAAWTQKLCMWANSQRCDEADPEFIRVANLFADGYESGSSDDYRLDILIRELFSSTLVTGATDAQSHERVEFMVSSTRYQHFCEATNARLRQASDMRCQDEGQDPSACEAAWRDCFGSWRTAEALGLDSYARGIREFTTPAIPDPVFSVSARGSCRELAGNATDVNGPFPRNGDEKANMRRMVETMMGLPASHPRHPAAVEVLTRTYQILRTNEPCPDGQDIFTANQGIPVDGEFVCGHGLNAFQAHNNLFVIACSSPDLTGIGL